MLASMKVQTIDLEFQGTRGAIAAFLLEGPEGNVLIETGPESTRPRLLQGLEELGCGVDDLSALLVTHIHLDHAGAAGWFAQQGVPVYVHRRGARHLIDPARLVESARQIYLERFDSLWGEMTPAPSDCVNELEDGDCVELGGLTIKAVETPGHAFHHHAFAVGDVIFAGDAAGVKCDESGFVSVASAPPQFHLEHTLESIKKMRSGNYSELYLTHFGLVGEVDAHLREYAEAVELNATFIRQRIEEKMDNESLQIAYQAFNMEQAFRFETSREDWDTIQLVNGTGMCADGIRLYWEKVNGEEA